MPAPLLKYPPGLNICLSDSRITDSREKENNNDDNPYVECNHETSLWDGTSTDIQPRIRSLVLPLRPRRSQAAYADGSALRKKLGHTAVMVACARQRMHRRKAASQAAVLARLFNFTGEWSSNEELL